MKSQHSPIAQVAFGNMLQVLGLQQGLSQCSFNPQSHSSPGHIDEVIKNVLPDPIQANPSSVDVVDR